MRDIPHPNHKSEPAPAMAEYKLLPRILLATDEYNALSTVVCIQKGKGKKYGWCTVLHGKPTTELRSIICHMGSHIASCNPTQVNMLHLNHSQTGRYSFFLPRRDERLS